MRRLPGNRIAAFLETYADRIESRKARQRADMCSCPNRGLADCVRLLGTLSPRATVIVQGFGRGLVQLKVKAEFLAFPLTATRP